MKYRSEDDKCYGVAGMAVGLSIFDAEDLFTEVTLDAEGLDCIRFAPDFYFAGNPRVEASRSWHHIYGHYQVQMGLAIANTLCRKMVLDRGVLDRKQRTELLNAAVADGQALCQLDRDEVEPLFDKSYSYLMRVFSNADIRHAISAFAAQLKQRRTLSRADVAELLQELNLR
ncbi:MAG: hypothetical protein IJ808_01995 [Muribaculaceae bacterium]|nr:hypothetical protein [Muribaculaceae bacterium]